MEIARVIERLRERGYPHVYVNDMFLIVKKKQESDPLKPDQRWAIKSVGVIEKLYTERIVDILINKIDEDMVEYSLHNWDSL